MYDPKTGLAPWRHDLSESDATYVDLPVSPMHPALSATVLRTVFDKTDGRFFISRNLCEDEAKKTKVWNRENEGKDLYHARKVYHKLLARMLHVTGYSATVRPRGQQKKNITLEEIVDAAEKFEAKMMKLSTGSSTDGGIDADEENIENVAELNSFLSRERVWTVDENGNVVVSDSPRRTE